MNGNSTIEMVIHAEQKPVSTREIHIKELVIAGWAGRNIDSMEEHIQELEAIGVARPRATPMFYRVANNLLTDSDQIQVVGLDSSAEVEVVMVCTEDGIKIGVGSDHTDRALETIGVTLSKQICPKPIGNQFWDFEEIEPHWDELILRSYIHENGERSLYQEASISTLLHPTTLLEKFKSDGGEFSSGMAMFCGTVPVRGKLRASSKVELTIEDPVLKRQLKHVYDVRHLDIVD